MTNLYDPNGSLYRERLRRALSDGRSEPPEAEKPAAEKSTIKCEVCGWHTNGVPYSEHVAALSQMDAAKQENNAWKVSVAEYVQQLESSLSSLRQAVEEAIARLSEYAMDPHVEVVVANLSRATQTGPPKETQP